MGDGANGPPPTVWWSSRVFRPQPVDGFQLAPASSEYDMRLHASMSCESKVRPVVRSVNVIASNVKIAEGAETSVCVTRPAASKTMRVSWAPAPNITALRIGSYPIDGSPPDTGFVPSVTVYERN